MECGVTFIDPASAYIEASVEIGRDSIIYPNTVLRGLTKIGHHTEVGPNSMLLDTKVGNHCMILQSVLEHAVLGRSCRNWPIWSFAERCLSGGSCSYG